MKFSTTASALTSAQITFLARSPAMSSEVKPSVEAQIVALRDKGHGILKIGKKLGIGTSVVQRVPKHTG